MEINRQGNPTQMNKIIREKCKRNLIIKRKMVLKSHRFDISFKNVQFCVYEFVCLLQENKKCMIRSIAQ